MIGNAQNVVGKYNNNVEEEQIILNAIEEYLNDYKNGEIIRTTIEIKVSTTALADKVIVTVIGKSEEGIKSFTSSTGENKTYDAEEKEINETIEITTNGTYTFTVENSKGKEISKEITISNILEGIIQIMPDKTNPTMENIKITVVWPNGSETGIKEIKIGENDWQTVVGETNEVEVTENCTVRARVSSSEAEIKSNSLTITNIDKTIPTVVLVSDNEETMDEGTSNEISKYFSYSANGTTQITTVTYTDTSNENKPVTNTNTLSVGTHIIKCTVTKETGATASATKTIIVEKGGLYANEIANNPNEHYGGEIANYTTPNGDPDVKWKIFYADENNIYLIATDYIKYNYCPAGIKGSAIFKNSDYKLSMDNVYKDYTGSVDISDSRIKKWIQKYLDVAPSSTEINIKSVAYMLDMNVWNSYYKGEYAEYAIGGPTLEMFVASYNQTHQAKPMYCKSNTTGYYISWSDGGTTTSISGLSTSESLYVINSTSKANAMCLASPTAYGNKYIMGVRYDGIIDQYGYNNGIARI